MRGSLGPLLCELHAHTRWSDGVLSVPELVDLHGRNGFDVLCITDHVVRTNDPWRERESIDFSSLDESTWPAYLADVEREAARAWRTYGMLVIPGLELTFNDDEPVQAAHALAIGLRSFVSVDDGIAEAMRTAAEAGAAIIAAHPNGDEPASSSGRLTRRFARDAGSHTDSSCSTGRSSSAGSPTPRFPQWRQATSIILSTSRAGRRSCRACRTRRGSSTISARRVPCT